MSTQKINTAQKIISAVKECMGFRKDIELAKWLGISAQTISNWKSRGYIADSTVFERKGFNPVWIKAGHGEMTLQQAGQGSIQGKSIEAENIHIAIHNGAVHEGQSDYLHIDPVDMAFLNDWRKLNEVAKMRVWMIIKEELAR